MDQSKLKPAIISGVIFGIVSLIPYVSLLNCCCGWLMICGLVGVKLYSSNNPNPTSYSDGAIVGTLSGAVAAIIVQIVTAIVAIFNFRNTSTAELKEIIIREVEKQPTTNAESLALITQWVDVVLNNLIVFALAYFLIALVIMTVFGALGGLAGASLFGKKTPPSAPPYDYGQSFGEGSKSSYPGQ